jgi:hypothetical protein
VFFKFQCFYVDLLFLGEFRIGFHIEIFSPCCTALIMVEEDDRRTFQSRRLRKPKIGRKLECVTIGNSGRVCSGWAYFNHSHSLLNVTSQSLLHGYLARALVLTDVLPPFFQGRMDCGATYWDRRTTFSKI